MFLVGVFCGIHRGRDPPCVLHFKNFRNLYFFKGMTTREIADKLGVSQNVVWKSIRGSINTLKKFFE